MPSDNYILCKAQQHSCQRIHHQFLSLTNDHCNKYVNAENTKPCHRIQVNTNASSLFALMFITKTHSANQRKTNEVKRHGRLVKKTLGNLSYCTLLLLYVW